MFSKLFAFIGRIMLALIFIISGAVKLADPAATGTALTSVGFPTSLALPAILFELIGGIMIALGVFTRIMSLVFAAFCLLTALLFHSETADSMQAAMAMKNVAIAGGFLCLFAYQGKAWSLDHYRERRRREVIERTISHDDSALRNDGSLPVVVKKSRWGL
jgi:putative oxidoreductase